MSGILGAQQGEFGRVTLFDIREPVADHAHPHVHLLFKLAGHDRGLEVGGERVLLEDGKCVLVGPWQRHADIRETCTDTTVMLALYIDAAYLRTRFDSLAPTVFSGASCRLSAAARRLVTEISALLQRGEPGDRVEEAIVELVEETLQSSAASEDASAGASDYRIRRAVARLSEHPHLHPDLEELASSVGLSRSRFFEQFKNAVGIAPTMYVDGLLLEEAISMLARPERSIEDISASLGFSAQSSFSRFFKDRVGFPPAVLRHAVLPD